MYNANTKLRKIINNVKGNALYLYVKKPQFSLYILIYISSKVLNYIKQRKKG